MIFTAMIPKSILPSFPWKVHFKHHFKYHFRYQVSLLPQVPFDASLLWRERLVIQLQITHLKKKQCKKIKMQTKEAHPFAYLETSKNSRFISTVTAYITVLISGQYFLAIGHKKPPRLLIVQHFLSEIMKFKFPKSVNTTSIAKEKFLCRSKRKNKF